MTNVREKLKQNKYNETYEVIEKKDLPKGPLSGLTYVTKDNINVKDTFTTCGSAVLSKYKSAFDATAIELLNKAGADNLAKVALDELGMGGTGSYSFKGTVLNPTNEKNQVGGSSSGSAAAMAHGIDFALGSDTGDSIRIPAAFTKIIGFKPSYGAVSRFGLAPYSPSLDCLSTFAKDFDVLKKVQKEISKKDTKDLTSFSIKETSLDSLKGAKVAILVDPIKNADESIRADFSAVLDIFEKNNIEPITFSLEEEVYDAIELTYLLIANAEALQAHLPLDGIKYGDRELYGADVRNKFGRNILRRYAFTGDKLLNDKPLIKRAYKFRRYVTEIYEEKFKDVDFIISLNNSDAYMDVEKRGGSKYTTHLQIANMAGLPSITFPLKDHGDFASSLNVCSKRGTDFALIDFAKLLGGEL